MANVLKKTDMTEWYRKLNIARTQAGVDLMQVSAPTSFTPTSSPVRQLIDDIALSQEENEFLGLADNTIDSDNTVSPGKKVSILDKDKIEDTITSMLRICANITCATQLCTDGICQNGTNNLGSNGNGSCSNGSHENGLYWTSIGAYNNGSFTGQSCGNGTCSQGTKANGTNTYGAKSNGDCQQGQCSNGYVAGTAVCTVKDYYSEEEANNR